MCACHVTRNRSSSYFQETSSAHAAVSKRMAQNFFFLFCWWNKLVEGTEKSHALLTKGVKVYADVGK